MAVLLVVMLSACATPSQTRLLLQAPPDIETAQELVAVPFYAQRDYQCGPAALATVINHYGTQTSVEALIPLVYIPQLKGSLQVEMEAVPNRFGRLAMRLDGTLESLLKEVDAGHPVLVMQNLGFDAYPFWHYAVAVGYDLANNEIILRSGERQRLVRPLALFERTWQRAGYWALVVVPPGQMPVTASEQGFTRALLNLEAVGVAEDYLAAYRAGVARWPDSFILNMGLGNAQFALAQFDAAVQSFRRATALEPQRAESWNNLAYALLKTGDRQAATEAVARAISLAPDNSDYRHSEREINQQLLTAPK